jgi:valyl-tRNA synthetase
MGQDPIRYWAASSKLGEDLDYQEKDLITGKKLIKKITNAANFIFMQIKEKPKNPDELIEFDRIFLLQLNKLIEKITVFFENYEYGRVKSEIENFFWNDFTDNYLEIVKNRVYNGDEKEKDSAFYTLYTSFLNLLKMFAPFICFTTEEVYQNYYKKYEKIKSIHLTEWPKI